MVEQSGAAESVVMHSTKYSVLSTQYMLAGVIALVALAGCEPVAEKAHDKPATGSGVGLVRGDAKKLEELIAKHQGKVVLVDYWATWCGPCVENFPHTVELAKKYRAEGLATIAVSFDLLDDEPKVREFLATQEAGFDHLLSIYDGVNQRAANDFDVEALPQYRLYDRQGKLRERWEGTTDEMESKIQQLLAESP